MALWTVLFIEFWKRQQNTYRFEWDTIDYENKYDVMRPEYERVIPKLPKNNITGEPMLTFSKRFLKYLMSWSVVFLAVIYSFYSSNKLKVIKIFLFLTDFTRSCNIIRNNFLSNINFYCFKKR